MSDMQYTNLCIARAESALANVGRVMGVLDEVSSSHALTTIAELAEALWRKVGWDEAYAQLGTGDLRAPTSGPHRRTDGDALAYWDVSPDGVWRLHDGTVLSQVTGTRPTDRVAFLHAVLAAHAYRPERAS